MVFVPLPACNRSPRPQVQQNCQNSPELFASHTIDDEVDGAVDDSQVPRDHVHTSCHSGPKYDPAGELKHFTIRLYLQVVKTLKNSWAGGTPCNA